MKLRIRGNSVRFRLGRSEVRRLAEEGVVSEKVCFGPLPAQSLIYALRSAAAAEITALFEDGAIVVLVPPGMVRAWADTELVGMEAVRSVDATNSLRILIEKDFECMEARAGESDDDAFPAPRGEAGALNAACG